MRHRLVIVTTTQEYLIPENGVSTLEERVHELFHGPGMMQHGMRPEKFRFAHSDTLVSVDVTNKSVDL